MPTPASLRSSKPANGPLKRQRGYSFSESQAAGTSPYSWLYTKWPPMVWRAEHIHANLRPEALTMRCPNPCSAAWRDRNGQRSYASFTSPQSACCAFLHDCRKAGNPLNMEDLRRFAARRTRRHFGPQCGCCSAVASFNSILGHRTLPEDDRRAPMWTKRCPSHRGGWHLGRERSSTAPGGCKEDACPQQVHHPTSGQRSGEVK